MSQCDLKIAVTSNLPAPCPYLVLNPKLIACRFQPEHRSLIIGIGPWHALGHKVECASKYGARALEGTGRTCGDAIEHLWALLRPHNPSLKYMAKGPMQDYIQHLVKYLLYLFDLSKSPSHNTYIDIK